MMDIADSNLFDITRFLFKNDAVVRNYFETKQFAYTLDNGYMDVKLPPRKSECLFFLLRGKTAKSIAQILGISSRTVESHIDKIKYRLKCSNKSQLIEKTWLSGYMNIIPEILLKNNLINGLP